MKKFLSLALSVIMIMSLVGCGSSDSASSDAIEVSYLCNDSSYVTTLIEKVDEWNATTGAEKGVRIYINLVSSDDYDGDLQSAEDDGEPYALFDAGDDTIKYYQNGWAKNLYEIENAELSELILGYESYLVGGYNVISDGLYALPLDRQPIMLAVNKDLFEKNGLEYPKTWDEMMACAKTITENGDGKEFGFGFSNEDTAMQELILEPTACLIGRSWWDPSSASYDFSGFKPALEDFQTMYKDGSVLGTDDMTMEQIYAQFAVGNVGMMFVDSDDYSVLKADFSASCDWTVVQVPSFTDSDYVCDGAQHVRAGQCIDATYYDGADEKTKQAIVDAFIFLNSDELLSELADAGGIIPVKDSLASDNDFSEQWRAFCDTTNYASLCVTPDSVLDVEDNDFETLFRKFLRGKMNVTKATYTATETYNNAYSNASEAGTIDSAVYYFDYSMN